MIYQYICGGLKKKICDMIKISIIKEHHPSTYSRHYSRKTFTMRTLSETATTHSTFTSLPIEIIQHINSFVQPIRQWYQTINSFSLEIMLDRVPCISTRDVYGYRRNDGKHHPFLWCGDIQLDYVDNEFLMLIANVITQRDYGRIAIRCLSLSTSPCNAARAIANDMQMVRDLAHFFARVTRLELFYDVPTWFIDYMHRFVSLRALRLEVRHTHHNIIHAYRIFTSSTFATLPISKLMIDNLNFSYGADKYDANCTPFIPLPLVIDPLYHFSLSSSTISAIHQQEALSETTTHTSQSGVSTVNNDSVDMFGAMIVALLRKSPTKAPIHTLRLSDMPVPLWHPLDIHQGIVPWQSLHKLIVYNTGIGNDMREFFLLKLPQLYQYEEHDACELLQIDYGLLAILSNTHVARVVITTELVHMHKDVLNSLFAIRVLKEFCWTLRSTEMPDLPEATALNPMEVCEQDTLMADNDDDAYSPNEKNCIHTMFIKRDVHVAADNVHRVVKSLDIEEIQNEESDEGNDDDSVLLDIPDMLNIPDTVHNYYKIHVVLE